MRLKGWASEVALSDMHGCNILTRYQDPANNSNKYRRFIVLSAPGLPHMLITHTGRWTSRTAAGIWDGGTYTRQGVATRSAANRYPEPMQYCTAMTNRKLHGYTIVGQTAIMTTSQLQQVIDLADLVDAKQPTPQPTPLKVKYSPPRQAAARRTLAGLTQPSTPVHSSGGALLEKINALLARASAGTEDPFDLFADLAIIKGEVRVLAAEVATMEDHLLLVSDTILLKENA